MSRPAWIIGEVEPRFGEDEAPKSGEWDGGTGGEEGADGRARRGEK